MINEFHLRSAIADTLAKGFVVDFLDLVLISMLIGSFAYSEAGFHRCFRSNSA